MSSPLPIPMEHQQQLSQAGRQKRLKAGTACTNCRRKKLRCTGTPHCARCVTHNLDCVVDEALFLKTNSAQSLYAKSSSSSSRPSPPSNSHSHRSKSSHQMSYPHGHHDQGSLSSSSAYSDDEMLERRHSLDFQSDRRMSASSATSISSLSPSPSPGYSYNNYSPSHTTSHNYSPFQFSSSMPEKSIYHTLSDSPSRPKKIPSTKKSSRPELGASGHSGSQSYSGPSSSIPSSSSNMASKKRASKDQGSIKPKQKRRNSRPDSESILMQNVRDSDRDPGSPSPLLSPQDSSSSTIGAKEEDFKSVVSTMSLDGHGQHPDKPSISSPLDPLPMAHLNDSDLWSHSLQMTSERELPSKAEMDNLLSLYFRYMYPFAPMFIRKTFMEQHQKRPDLSQILILNAIFCNACWYSDDPLVKSESTKFFNRAKIILDETYHVSRISTVQALLLMSHHQYAVGNYSGGWLYTGMATRIAHDIGLHRQDVQVNEPEEAEVRKRVWWAVYIADRLGGGILGRPLNLRDKEYNVQMPSDDWIAQLGGDDAVEYPYEPERIISCRLLWAVKLFMQMGNVLNTMHCIEAEINGAFLADISRTQLPQLHNSLTSWFLSLPNELMYTPYTMSPNSNHPPSPPTALMHMFYYTTLTMLHRPYLRPVNSAAIDPNFLVSSRNICTAAATNVCHIADSLMLHGQLRDTCYYGMACLLAAGTVHVHNAITPTPSNRETTRAGLSKTVKAAHELVKTFPVAESLIAVALDVFASQTSSVPTEMAASFIDISTFVAPFIDMTQLQSTSIGNIYEAARLAKLAKDGPGPAPSIQLRHPYGNFSMPLPEQGKDQSSTNLSSMWQSQIATAVAMAAIAFGGTDPQQEQQFFANPLELPEALRLAPIDTMMFQADGSLAGTGLDSFGTDPLNLGSLSATSASPTFMTQQVDSHLLQYQAQTSQTQTMQSFQQPQQPQSQPQPQPQPQPQSQTQPQQQQQSPAQNTTQFSSNQFNATHALNLMQATLASSLQVSESTTTHSQPQPQHAMMEDDTADPPSPPAISSDDMDMEGASLAGDTPSPDSSSVPRQDAQTQCETSSGYSSNSTSSHESFMSSLTEGSDRHDSSGHMPFFMSGQTNAGQVQQQQQNNPGCHKDVQKGIKNDYYANDPHNPGNLVRRASNFSQTHRSDSDRVTRNTSIRSTLTSIVANGDTVASPAVNLPPVLIPAIVRQTSFGEQLSTKMYQYDSYTNYYYYDDDNNDDDNNDDDNNDDKKTRGLEATNINATVSEPMESTGSDVKKQPQVAQTIPSDQTEGDDDEGGGFCGLFGKKKKGNQPKKQVEAVGYWQLYRFASKRDWFYVTPGIICSLGVGVGQPTIALLFGNIVNGLTDGQGDKGQEILHNVVLFTIVGCAMFVAGYGQMCFWTLSTEHQSKHIREKYFHAILRQNMSWHDTGKQSESLTTRLSSDTQLIYDGLADKGWRLSLVLLCAVPLIGAAAAFMAKYTVESSSEGQGSYTKAGAVAEQAFSSIRTVVAFGGQKRETRAYLRHLDDAFATGSKKAIVTGVGSGVLNIFKTIDRIPVIDSADLGGAKPDNIQGHIVVINVDFSHPSRPDIQILKKMDVEVKPGQTIALVGQSGSGKSTIVGLVERFYDPTSGSITLDGIEIKDNNVTFLRDTIGIVSQEPVLFNASIKQNIIYGIRKDQAVPTDQEIEDACCLSNAHDFISKLPDKYDTIVGEKGALLSGGQKQRVAIARALIKNPRILLLDEATSALDTESERTVQAALDNASAGRSTIVVAHRLSTIMNADIIYVMEKGIVIESGTHKSLLEKESAYAELVAKQQLKTGGTDVERPHTGDLDDASLTASSATKPEMNRRKSSKIERILSKRSSIMSKNRVDSSIPIEEDIAMMSTEEKAAVEKKLAKKKKAPIGRVIGIMKPELAVAALGGLMSGISGAIFPVFSNIFSKMLNILTAPESPTFTRDSDFYSLMFVVIAIVALFSNGISIYIFELIDEKMARRMRTLSFKAIMSQEMGFFDREENSTGALSSRLATDAYQMHELVSQLLKTACSTIAILVIGLVFAFTANWILTFIILALIPVLGLAQYYEIAALTGFGAKAQKAYEKSGRVAGEAIANIRT
ncbi:hypothetical protein BGZ52_010321, partial [Haplosporangium bisporale]